MNTLRKESIRAGRAENAAAMFAALIMAVGMGFGRFAFTGIYPFMVSDGALTVHQGTLAASANYAGYLLGALLTAAVHPRHSRRLCVLALVGIAACLALTALAPTPAFIIVMRAVTGVASAVTMVAASLWLLQHRGHAGGAPILYAGVGVGIVLSSEILALVKARDLHSVAMWWALAAAAIVAGVIARSGLDAGAAPKQDAQKTRGGHESFPALSAVPLIALYGLAGFGYIITATYLPLFVKNAVESIDPLQIWALFGLGAIPSCFIWHRIHMRLGTRRALALNLVTQAIGVVLPVLAPTVFGYLGSALLVGGSFMGTATIAMLAARRVAHTLRHNILALMTACFGIGQIAGPLVANALYSAHHSFNGSLLTAGSALLAGALLCTPLSISVAYRFCRR